MPTHGAIDVDRDVSMRQIVKFDKNNAHKFEPDMSKGGMIVYMYKDDPGKYYDVHGNAVPDGLAAMAGYPVDKLAKSRRKKEAMAKFESELAAQLALEDQEEVIVLEEAGDWQIIALPMDRAKIVDKETGSSITPTPMSRADAKILLKHLTGTASEVKKATAEK